MKDTKHGNRRSNFDAQSAMEAIVENISDAVMCIDREWRLSYFSHVAEQVTGLDAVDVVGKAYLDVFPGSRGTLFDTTYQRVRQTGESEKFDAPLGASGAWFTVSVFPIHDEQLCVAFRECSHAKRQEVIADAQRNALDKVLSGGELDEVLAILVDAVEQQSGRQAVAAINVIDEAQTSLLTCVAPHFSGMFKNWVQHLKLNPQTTPCGLSAVQRQPVTVENMATVTEWRGFSQKAREEGVQACWCMPIFSTQSKLVLGTFGLYYPVSGAPAEADMQVVMALAPTAAIAIERILENDARVRAETALTSNTLELQRLQRLYQTALSNSPDPLYIFDLDGRFTYANDALLELWGIDWDQAIGKTCLELGYEPWHAQMHERELRQVIETKQPLRSDVPFSGTFGRRIYEYIFVPVLGEGGNVEAVAGSTRDVTERQQAVELAREAENRRRLALEASHGFGIWVWDIKQDVFTADERLGELFNLSSQEVASGVSLARAMRHLHPDDANANRLAINECIEHGELYDQQYRIVHNDGSVRWGSFRGRVLFDETGEASKFSGVGVDVTRERNAITALKEADRRKDEFLATLAHELRNPLAPISNSLKILESDHICAQRKQTAFKLVERQVQQMIRLVDDLMDVSRITRGKIRLNLTSVNLTSVIETTIETIQPMLDECKHTLSVNFPSQPVWVNGDAVRLAQVFLNIINNAAKYTDTGGHISVAMHSNQTTVDITVTDNGAGIPAEKLETVFDMFTQVDGVLERSQGGLGIGLTLVKRLTELHQGNVTVNSDGPGQGARFRVSLPIINPPQDTVQKQTIVNARASQSTPLNVLIADDNQDAAITMGWILEAKGCQVTVVEDGQSALRAVEKMTPDLVLLDIGMPEMNGYDLCIALRKRSALKNAIFVAQTGWGQPEHIQRSRASGFHHHLVKPLNLDDLLPILTEARKAKAQT